MFMIYSISEMVKVYIKCQQLLQTNSNGFCDDGSKLDRNSKRLEVGLGSVGGGRGEG